MAEAATAASLTAKGSLLEVPGAAAPALPDTSEAEAMDHKATEARRRRITSSLKAGENLGRATQWGGTDNWHSSHDETAHILE